MIWLLTLSLEAAHDGGLRSTNPRALAEATYRICVVEGGVVRDYLRSLKGASVLDAMASLPGDLILKLSKARISVTRGGSRMEVDWRGIVCNGQAKMNYALCQDDTILVALP